MTSATQTVAQYIEEVPEEQKAGIINLRNCLLNYLPIGFQEEMSYGMIGYVIPHSLYPSGYHCNPKLPLPFMSFACQKNSINFYHMGLYAIPDLYAWFVAEFPKHSIHKLDMGKSCIRFKKTDHIPFGLISELVQKISVSEWIATYETVFKK